MEKSWVPMRTEAKEAKEVKEIKEVRQVKEVKEVKEIKEFKEVKERASTSSGHLKPSAKALEMEKQWSHKFRSHNSKIWPPPPDESQVISQLILQVFFKNINKPYGVK